MQPSVTPAVDDEGGGPVVDEADAHVAAEFARCNGHASRAEQLDQLIEQHAPRLWRRRTVEARPAAAFRVGGDGKVADQEDPAADVAHAEIEVLFAGRIAEDSER